MSTKKTFRCDICNDEKSVGDLFSALYSISKNELFKCNKCEDCYKLYLSFQYSFGVIQAEGEVIAAFLPESLMKWNDNGDEITYYPFLVVLKYHYGKEIWLPYWHVIKRGEQTLKRYGQWAPVLRKDDFMQMVEKAKTKEMI